MKTSENTRHVLERLASELTKFDAPNSFEVTNNCELHWLDEEGTVLEVYGPRMVKLLLSLDKAGLEDFVMDIANTRSKAWDKGERYGYERGRREIIRTVHELLGIDKLTMALGRLEAP